MAHITRRDLNEYALGALNAPANVKWKRMVRERESKVESIKECRREHGIGLKEAKDAMEVYHDEWFNVEKVAVRQPQRVIYLPGNVTLVINAIGDDMFTIDTIQRGIAAYKESELLQVVAAKAVEVATASRS